MDVSRRRCSFPLGLFVACTVLSGLTRGALGDCLVHTDQEGPFHLAGAPFRGQGVVCTPNPSEDLVTLTGRVLTSDCQAVLPNAVLDIWQASSDDKGAHYYGCPGCEGPLTDHPDGEFYCRGKVRADANGTFVLRTIKPGRYPERPVMHLHVRVLEEGEMGAAHITQLYFEDDIRSASYRDEVRLSVSSDGTAVLDIATPFSGGVPLQQLEPTPSTEGTADNVEESQQQEDGEEEEEEEEEERSEIKSTSGAAATARTALSAAVTVATLVAGAYLV